MKLFSPSVNLEKWLIFSLLLVVTACDEGLFLGNGGECGDSSGLIKELDIVDMQLSLFDLQNGNDKVVYSEVTPVEFDHLLFTVDYETQVIVSNEAHKKGISFSIIPSAYACSPSFPTTNERIVDIEITSSFAFNRELDAGDVLNSQFLISFDYDDFEDGQDKYPTVTDFLSRGNANPHYGFQLQMALEPEFEGSHIFFVKVTLDTGEIFALETQEVNIVK